MDLPEEVLQRLREKWIKVALECTPIDVEKSKALINQIYLNADEDYDVPEFYFVANSPPHAIKIRAALKEIGYKNLVNDPNYEERVYEKALDPNLDTSGDVILSSQLCFGNHEAPVLAFYDYFMNEYDGEIDAKGKENLEKVKPFIELADVCGWWVPMKKAVILIHRPNVINMDHDYRLHCEDGPAIAYLDSNYKVYAWHGTQIPEEWIEDKESLTPEIALTHVNMEERRTACEILGWDNILKTLNYRVIDENPDPQIGTLIEAALPDLGEQRFLRVLCGTGRYFSLTVPPDCETAHEANAWTFGVPANEYFPEVGT